MKFQSDEQRKAVMSKIKDGNIKKTGTQSISVSGDTDKKFEAKRKTKEQKYDVTENKIKLISKKLQKTKYNPLLKYFGLISGKYFTSKKIAESHNFDLYEFTKEDDGTKHYSIKSKHPFPFHPESIYKSKNKTKALKKLKELAPLPI